MVHKLIKDLLGNKALFGDFLGMVITTYTQCVGAGGYDELSTVLVCVGVRKMPTSLFYPFLPSRNKDGWFLNGS